MSPVSELWRILTPQQRRGVLAAQVISLAMAFSTVTGIAAIAPFFAVLGDPRSIDHLAPLHWLYARAGFADHRSFVVALGIAFIGVMLLANLINVLGSRGRYTSILVAHRMSTVRTCDVIFEIENGKVAGSGTYDGLLNDSDAFRRMAGLR